MASLNAQQRYDVDSKAESLHKHWIELKDMVLRRVDCVNALIEFYEKANEFDRSLKDLKQQLKETPNEQRLKVLQESWQTLRHNFSKLKECGSRFLHWKVCKFFHSNINLSHLIFILIF